MKKTKIIKKLLSFIVVVVIILLVVYLLINSINITFGKLNIDISKSIFKDIQNIDYQLFFTTSFSTLFISAFIVSFISFSIGFLFKLSSDIIDKMLKFGFQITTILAIVIPMLISLTKEQFNVATTVLSFLALFSSAIPKIMDK